MEDDKIWTREGRQEIPDSWEEEADKISAASFAADAKEEEEEDASDWIPRDPNATEEDVSTQGYAGYKRIETREECNRESYMPSGVREFCKLSYKGAAWYFGENYPDSDVRKKKMEEAKNHFPCVCSMASGSLHFHQDALILPPSTVEEDRMRHKFLLVVKCVPAVEFVSDFIAEMADRRSMIHDFERESADYANLLNKFHVDAHGQSAYLESILCMQGDRRDFQTSPGVPRRNIAGESAFVQFVVEKLKERQNVHKCEDCRFPFFPSSWIFKTVDRLNTAPTGSFSDEKLFYKLSLYSSKSGFLFVEDAYQLFPMDKTISQENFPLRQITHSDGILPIECICKAREDEEGKNGGGWNGEGWGASATEPPVTIDWLDS